MNLTDLSLVAEVARLGSFADVARMRGTNPSQVSRAVSAIEADLGLRLFQRTTRTLSLTEEGDAFLARILPLIEEMERLTIEARSIKMEPQGLLRLTASVTFGHAILLPVLGDFRARYPKVELECLFTDANLDLIAERIDLAIRLAPAVAGDVIASRLMSTRYRVVASPKYLAAEPPLECPSDLARHKLILFTFRPFRNRWIFRDRMGHETEQSVRGTIMIAPAGAILDAARMDLGVALLPNYLTDPHIASGSLVRCLPDWDVTATTFDTAAWLVYPTRSYLPAKTRAMIDFLRDKVAAAHRL